MTEEEEFMKAVKEELEREEFQTTLNIQVKLDKSGLVRFEINEKVEAFVLDRSRIVWQNTSEGATNPKGFLRLLEAKFMGAKLPQNTINSEVKMDKNEFIQQASIQMMATASVKIAILITQGLVPSKQEVTINGVIDAAEQLWQELKKRGYTESEEATRTTTAFPEYSHSLDPEVREAIVAIFD